MKLKLKTSADRINAVKKLFHRALRIDDEFRNSDDKTSFGDIIGLVVMMERLKALEDIIYTEIFLENMINDASDIPVDEQTREQFMDVFAIQTRNFLRIILVRRIERAISFAENTFLDRRVVRLQKDFRELMIALRERYHEICSI